MTPHEQDWATIKRVVSTTSWYRGPDDVDAVALSAALTRLKAESEAQGKEIMFLRAIEESQHGLQDAYAKQEDTIARLTAEQKDFMQAAKESGYASNADDAFRQVSQAVVMDAASVKGLRAKNARLAAVVAGQQEGLESERDECPNCSNPLHAGPCKRSTPTDPRPESWKRLVVDSSTIGRTPAWREMAGNSFEFTPGKPNAYVIESVPGPQPTPALTPIEVDRVQALERDVLERQLLADEWMRRHDWLLGFVQRHPEMLSALIKERTEHPESPLLSLLPIEAAVLRWTEASEVWRRVSEVWRLADAEIRGQAFLEYTHSTTALLLIGAEITAREKKA